MDPNRVKFAMMLAIAVAAVFVLMFVRRFLGMVKLSLRAIVCMMILVAICVAFWMARDPSRLRPADRPAYQTESSVPLRR